MAPTPDRIRTEEYVKAMAATDTIALLAQRVQSLLSHGRRMSMTDRYVHHDGPNATPPHLYTGVTQDGEFKLWPDGNGFSVNLKPGLLGVGVSAYASDGNGTEAEAWKRYHAGKDATDRRDRRRNMTLVTINGGLDNTGPGRFDALIIQYWNEHGVCLERVIGFDYDSAPGKLADITDEISRHLDTDDRVSDQWMLEYVLKRLETVADIRTNE